MSKLTETFLASKELKRTIVERCNIYDIHIRYLCHEAGINYRDFMQQYVNTLGVSRFEITETQIEKVLKLLGIDVRMTFVVNTSTDMDAVRKELVDKYAVSK